ELAVLLLGQQEVEALLLRLRPARRRVRRVGGRAGRRAAVDLARGDLAGDEAGQVVDRLPPFPGLQRGREARRDLVADRLRVAVAARVRVEHGLDPLPPRRGL